MEAQAFQKVYTKISQITKATCSLHATDVGYDELALINGRLAQVVKIIGDTVTLQVFGGTEGIPTNAEVKFLGKAPSLKVSDDLAGRFFNAFGEPIDGGKSGAAQATQQHDLYRYCRHRPEQFAGHGTEDTVFCRSRPAL